MILRHVCLTVDSGQHRRGRFALEDSRSKGKQSHADTFRTSLPSPARLVQVPRGAELCCSKLNRNALSQDFRMVLWEKVRPDERRLFDVVRLVWHAGWLGSISGTERSGALARLLRTD